MAELFPPIEPHDQGLLDVGDGHHVYWETCGNPEGKPAVVLHGGPGQGSTPGMRRMFDPARYRVVLLDQRGCGRSTPHALDSVHGNTTGHLVADLERLREHLGIERWLVTGGSWGTTLALVYAERFPERVTELVVSAISTTRRGEIDWLYRGLRRFFPEEWARFTLGADDDVAAYARLLADPDPAVHRRAAAAWCRWEEVVLSLEPGAPPVSDAPVNEAALAFARLTTHYYANAGWLEEGAVIRDAGRLAGIPGVLIHGRLDLSCPVTTAVELAAAWPGAELLVDDHSGHRASDVKRAWKLEALARFAA
ncbi:prolyl aminopeptidase [Amycolatopsis sp. NPDC003865]